MNLIDFISIQVLRYWIVCYHLIIVYVLLLNRPWVNYCSRIINIFYDICNIAHPFFAKFRDPDENLTAERMVDEHEGENYTVAKWKCK